MVGRMLFLMFFGIVGVFSSAAAGLDVVSVPFLPSLERAMGRVGARLSLTDADRERILSSALAGGPTTQSVQGRPLWYFVFEASADVPAAHARSVLLTGGIHGDEVSPQYSAWRAVVELLADPSRLPRDVRVIVAPCLNPDGLIAPVLQGRAPTRANAAGVDLNRDFVSTRPQPETLFVKWLIEEYKPEFVVALHAPLKGLDYDGPAENPEAPAEVQAQARDWIASVHDAAPSLPVGGNFGVYLGSLGTYAGRILGLHTLTIEYPSNAGTGAERDWREFGEAVFRSLNPP